MESKAKLENNRPIRDYITDSRLHLYISDWYHNFMIQYEALFDESGIKQSFSEYNRKLHIVTLAVFTVSLLGSIGAMETITDYGLLTILATSLTLSTTLTLLSLTIGVVNPVYQKGQSMKKLEDNLIYSVSYMAILSASGMPIERILRRISEVEDNPPLKNMTHKFLVNVGLVGEDVLSALSKLADISPSKTLAKQIESIRMAIMTSGDLKSILLYEVDRLTQRKREKMKESINTLVYLGEIYVTMMVVTPILFILMITIFSIMGGMSFGGSSVVQLNLIIFFGIPVMAAAFIIILDQVLVIEE